MMKKILLLLTCFCCMFLAGGMAFANKVAPLSTYGYFTGAPRFLGGDKNFICIEVYQGYGFYLDRSSMYVEKNEPPQHIIAVNVCMVPDVYKGATAIARVKTERFFYNTELKQMYHDKGTNSDWKYINPAGAIATTSVVMPAGEMAFYLTYHKKFYGNGSHYSPLYGRNIPNFTDDFYTL
ncbi:MAG: hypothetical protein PUD48_00915 [Megasphaera elsdenii]|nr:hypothetical protein [Megasphaera elsdenii]